MKLKVHYIIIHKSYRYDYYYSLPGESAAMLAKALARAEALTLLGQALHTKVS